MFGLPNPYLIGGVALLIASLTGWALWERHDAIAAAKGEKAALERMELAQADATRWQDASGQRDLALNACYADRSKQSAEVEKLGEAKKQAEVIAAAWRTDAETARAAADVRIKDLMEEINAKPADVRGLGPIVLRRVNGLFDR